MRLPIRNVSNRLDTRDLDAIVLAGGESRRMGSPKAVLPLGDTTIIGMVIARLQAIFRQVYVVGRNQGELAGLDAVLLDDDRVERGPMVGLARGLAFSDAPWCFVVGCDMPFLNQSVIRRMVERLNGCDILAPYVGGHFQPLHAFYSGRCIEPARILLDSGITSLQSLFQTCNTQTIDADDFLDIDPDLLSFRDLDTVEEYLSAQKLARNPDPSEVFP